MCVGLILFSLTITLKTSVNMLLEKILKLKPIAKSKFFLRRIKLNIVLKKKNSWILYVLVGFS